MNSLWLEPCFKDLEFLSMMLKTLFVEQILLICKVRLYQIPFLTDVGCSVLVLRNVCLFFCIFLKIFVLYIHFCIYECYFSFRYFDISNSNLIVGCLVLSSFRNLIRTFLLPVHMENISSMDLK